jgi:hypothetical protein
MIGGEGLELCAQLLGVNKLCACHDTCSALLKASSELLLAGSTMLAT